MNNSAFQEHDTYMYLLGIGNGPLLYSICSSCHAKSLSDNRLLLTDQQFDIHTIIRSTVACGTFPSPLGMAWPARPKRISHATEGTRLHRPSMWWPWAASLLTLWHVFNTSPFRSPSRTHTVRLPHRSPLQSLQACAAILQQWPWFFI